MVPSTVINAMPFNLAFKYSFFLSCKVVWSPPRKYKDTLFHTALYLLKQKTRHLLTNVVVAAKAGTAFF